MNRDTSSKVKVEGCNLLIKVLLCLFFFVSSSSTVYLKLVIFNILLDSTNKLSIFSKNYFCCFVNPTEKQMQGINVYIFLLLFGLIVKKLLKYGLK